MGINIVGWLANGILLFLILTKSSIWVKHNGKEVHIGAKDLKKYENEENRQINKQRELVDKLEKEAIQLKDSNKTLTKILENNLPHKNEPIVISPPPPPPLPPMLVNTVDEHNERQQLGTKKKATKPQTKPKKSHQEELKETLKKRRKALGEDD